jgi:uncharacterized linocin/CFP29 family protein
MKESIFNLLLIIKKRYCNFYPRKREKGVEIRERCSKSVEGIRTPIIRERERER